MEGGKLMDDGGGGGGGLNGKRVGFLSVVNEEEEEGGEVGSGDDRDNDDEADGERPAKKARVESEDDSNSVDDPALDLLQEALEAVPTSKMYLEGTRFLRMRIQRLLLDNDNAEDDISHLIGGAADEDANAAAERHVQLLKEMYANATKKNVSSTSLILDHADFLLSSGQRQEAEQVLSNATTLTLAKTTDTKNVRIWLRWAELSSQVESPSTTPANILRRALKYTPLHDRYAHTLILTELMQYLMNTKPSTSKSNEELKLLFQKLILLSQGSNYSISKVKRSDDDEAEDEGAETVNIASTFVAYLKHSILDDDDPDGARSIYTSVLYHSNYGKSCSGKTQDEVLSMKSFFDLCIQYEKTNNDGKKRKKGKHQKEKMKKARKMRLCKLYEAGVGFFGSCGGGISVWRNVVDGYTRDLSDAKYSL